MLDLLAEPADFKPCMVLCSSDLEHFQYFSQIYHNTNLRLFFFVQLLVPPKQEQTSNHCFFVMYLDFDYSTSKDFDLCFLANG